MNDDLKYLVNYKPDTLYLHPGQNGTYATLVGEGEQVLGEIDVGLRFKLAVSAFYINEKKDFGTFKLTKLKFHKSRGWSEDGHIQINGYQLSQLQEFVQIIGQLDLTDIKKARISLNEINVDAFNTILNSDKGKELIKEIAQTPDLQDDIYALATKREALATFEDMLDNGYSEPEWQHFFEVNPWIFGHGLNYVFAEKVGQKLENTTTGAAFGQPGKRVDALMRTKAEISQYVLVEIKRPDTELLSKEEYRAGCWSASNELSGAITQIQKTVYEFTKNRFRDELKDENGDRLEQWIYSVKPKSYLVIGRLAQLANSDDKISCFELLRHNIQSPDIITYDELFERAKCIVENVSVQRTS